MAVIFKDDFTGHTDGSTITQQGDWSSKGDLTVDREFIKPAATSWAYTTADDKTPDTPDQQVRVLAAALNETGSTNKLQLLLRLDDGFPTTPTKGYVADIRFSTAVREVKLQKWDDDAAGTVVDLVSAATDITTNLLTAAASSISVLQDYRFQAHNLADGGVLLRFYCNEDDDDNPTVEFTDRGRGATAHEVVDFRAGFWGFGGTDANGFIIETFEGQDYKKTAYGSFRPDLLTLGDIKTAVKRVVNRSAQSNFPDANIAEFANFVQDEIVVELGDSCVFLERTETLSLRADSNRHIVMPPNVRTITWMKETSDLTIGRKFLDWKFISLGHDGRLIIQLDPAPTGKEFLVSYIERYDRMDESDDTSPCAIPRMYERVLIYGIAFAMAEQTGDNAFRAAMEKRYYGGIQSIRRDQSRLLRMKKTRLMVPRRSRVNSVVPLEQIWGNF